MNRLARQLMRLMLVALAASTSFLSAAEQPPAPVRGYRLEFPRDEGSHPQYRTEWWYVTGWLEDESGAHFGFQVTFFRSRPGIDEDNPSRFAAKQLLFAHIALSDPRAGRLLRDEKSARAGFGLAQAAEGSLDVSIDEWYLRQGTTYRTHAVGRDFSLDLELQATQPPLLQGDAGFSQKGPDPAFASYYYSLPQLQVGGHIGIGQRRFAVRGSAWMDHEWSGTVVDSQAQGWDWAALNLDDGGALMAFRMRGIDGGQRWAAATLRPRGGTASTYAPGQIEWSPLREWTSPRTGLQYPVEWRIRIGERTIRLVPLQDDQENDARGSTGTIYWEGAVRAYDEHDVPIGRGYLELTGYGKRLKL